MGRDTGKEAMREEEAGTRYLSPLVKQDLAKLGSDGESRRLALKSLKQFIEQLDTSSMPKFLAQIAESREPGGSRSYAISLYEEVARVHRKLIKPHLPRVISSLIRALAASGSSPHLQQACAKVTAAMARYTIDPTMCIEDAEEIIRNICNPLAEALAGKLEPVTAGAAACIHALIETENWKYACDETVQEVCQRTSVALSDIPTRTVFHLQLASALASMNPDTLGLYGATLLRAGEEILKTAVDSWQLRKAAAKLLQGVLTILDKETLESEVDLAIHALESCRLDKMPHVRAAVSEALCAAKILASGDSTQFCGMSSGPLPKSICESVEQSHSSWTKGGKEQGPSPWTLGDVSSSPVLQKRIVSPTSQESNQLSFSPVSTSTMESVHFRHILTPTRRSNSRRSKRTPLYPASGTGVTRSPRCDSPGTFSPSSSECEFTPQKLDAKENMPAWMTNMKEPQPNEEFGHVEVQTKVILRTPTPSQQLDHKSSVDIHTPESKGQYFAENLVDRSGPHAGKEASESPNSMISRHIVSPMVSAILDELTETASSILAEDDAGLALLDSQIEEACNLKCNFKHMVLPRLRLGSFSNSDSPSKSGYAAGASNSKQSFSCTANQLNEKSPSGPDVWNTSGCVELCVEVQTRDINLAATDTTRDFAPSFEGCDDNLLRGIDSHEPVAILKHHYNALAHLDSTPEKSKPLITTKDCLPFATPKRLMRALQLLDSSNPDSRRDSLNQDTAFCQDDGIPSMVDMDVETSSEGDWSVRDNPIASDESLQAESSDEEELEDRLKRPSDGTQPQNILSTNALSPRDIHVLSPVCRESPSVDVEEVRLHQEDTYDFTLDCVSSKSITPICTQVHDYIKCSSIYSTFCTDIHRSMSSEVCTNIPIVEDSDLDTVELISSGPTDGQDEDVVKKNGLRCNIQASNEGYETVKCCRLKSSERNPQRWWNIRGLGRYMLVRLMSRDWRNLCWYGEILLGGTLCLVLTLPLAMALANALTSAPGHLVPT